MHIMFGSRIWSSGNHNVSVKSRDPWSSPLSSYSRVPCLSTVVKNNNSLTMIRFHKVEHAAQSRGTKVSAGKAAQDTVLGYKQITQHRNTNKAYNQNAAQECLCGSSFIQVIVIPSLISASNWTWLGSWGRLASSPKGFFSSETAGALKL